MSRALGSAAPGFGASRRWMALTALSVALSACGAAEQAPSAATAAPVEETAPAPEAPAAAPAIAARLKAGTPYAEALPVIAAEGWLPLQDREACRQQLGDRAGLCRNAPELAACDQAAATCRLQFAQLGSQQTLSIEVGAPSGDEDEGPVRFGALKSWAFAARSAPPTASAGCPAADFDGFLKAFSSDPGVRQRYTAPLVQVTQSFDEQEAGYVQRQVLVAAEDYADFSLAYRDGGYHVVDSAGGVSPAAVPLQIQREAGEGYYVKIPDDVEGMSYRFERHQGCWRLATDPDPGGA